MDKAKSWTDPIGIWSVSTESDCEGRGIRNLGIFQGHFCEIALGLADKSMYSLYFKKITPAEMIAPNVYTREEVQITFDDRSRNDSDEAMIREVRKHAAQLNIDVDKGMWSGHLTLHRPITEEDRKRRALAKAKAVLTPEELRVLGL